MMLPPGTRLGWHVGIRFCAVALSVVTLCGQVGALAPNDIAQAIEWGRSGRAEPYTLRSVFPHNKTRPGVAYTPYVRVALAARAAMQAELEFGPSEVTQEMTAPLVYFAIGDAGPDPLPGSLAWETSLRMRLVTPHSDPMSPSRRQLSPVWMTRDIPNSLRYGLRPDWSYVVGAFRIEDVKPDTRVELYREFRDGSHHQVLAAPGLITEEDLRVWR
jgi:hypothetical protein